MMPASIRLEDYLKSKQKEVASRTPIDWQARKERWIEEVRQLLDNIRVWMAPLQEFGLTLSEDSETLLEEHIGHYTVPVLILSFGENSVFVRPRGTLVLGGLGRVDLSGKNGVELLILEEWGEWKYFDKAKNQRVGATVAFTDLDEQVFKSLILDLIAD